jgi:hypothetical protein
MGGVWVSERSGVKIPIEDIGDDLEVLKRVLRLRRYDRCVAAAEFLSERIGC